MCPKSPATQPLDQGSLDSVRDPPRPSVCQCSPTVTHTHTRQCSPTVSHTHTHTRYSVTPLGFQQNCLSHLIFHSESQRHYLNKSGNTILWLYHSFHLPELSVCLSPDCLNYPGSSHCCRGQPSPTHSMGMGLVPAVSIGHAARGVHGRRHRETRSSLPRGHWGALLSLRSS